MADYSSTNNYQSLADLLKPKEEEQLFSSADQLMSPINPTPEQLSALTQQQAPEPEIEQPVMKAAPAVPKQAKPSAPAEDDSLTPPAPEKPLSKLDQLEAMMKELQATSSKDLEEARKSDRMLKIGGALGDALATYLNAQGQMNVKAPGVQVQQGAGLGKVADMFATAPEIQSDIKSRSEALMKQYGELAKGERAQARLTSEEKLAKDRMTQQERLTQAEIDARLEAARIGTAAGATYKDQESKKRDERFIKGKMDNLMGSVARDFRYKDAYKESLSLDQVDRLLKAGEEGNQVAFNTVGTKMAKAMGEVGVLTESDVKRYIEGGSLTRKAGDSLLRMINGKPSQATINEIKEITGVLKSAHESKLQPMFDEYIRRAVQIGKTREQAYKEFGFPLPDDLKQQQETKKEEQLQISTDFEPKIDKVLKANPGASRQQVIDALKKDKKLPSDYK